MFILDKFKNEEYKKIIVFGHQRNLSVNPHVIAIVHPTYVEYKDSDAILDRYAQSVIYEAMMSLNAVD